MGFGLGKTETIKERSIYVYLPSVEKKKRWDDYAEKQGTSISKFVVVAMQSQSLKAILFVELLQVFHRGKIYAKISIAAQDGFRERGRLLEWIPEDAH